MKNKISLSRYNRYNHDIWLERVEDHVYELRSNNPSDLYCMRVIGGNGNNCTVAAVDPSGGPYLGVGGVYNGVRIIKIIAFPKEPIKFYLEDAKHN